MRPALAVLSTLLYLVSVALADPIVITSSTTIDAGNAGTYQNQDVIVRGCVVTINVPLSLDSLIVERNAANAPGVVTHAAALPGGLQLAVVGDVVVQGAEGSLVASRIDASEQGYPAGSGPGAGAGSAFIAGGGGHGGCGAPSSGGHAGGSSYDDVKLPVAHGSGGGSTSWAPGGAGGGCITLQVGGTLVLNGVVTANGGNGQRAYDTQASGAGAGGTVCLTVGHLTGAGSLTANGGYGLGCNNGTSGGGAGGRVAIHATATTFTGTLTAIGDRGGQYAGAGTVFTKVGGQLDGLLTVANGGHAGEATPSLAPDGFDEVAVGTGARLALSGGTALTADLLRVTQGGRVEIDTTVDFGAVLVQAGGVIAPVAGNPSFQLRAVGHIEIEAGGAIDATALGHPTSTGPGAGMEAPYYASGAGYGGRGGNSGTGVPGGSAYGSRFTPLDMGSGGGAHTTYYQPGGAGGGVLRITAGGTLIVNGAVRADGSDGQEAYGFSGSGGGAGGSVLLEVGRLSGSGTISADGGAGPLQAGGGAGGRIAVYTCDWQMNPALITAAGGSGYQAGEQGTVLHVSPFITIAQQPAAQLVFFGSPVTFHVAASTTQGTLHYQWRKDDVDLENTGHYTGVLTHTLNIDAANYDDNGYYDVWLTDDCGNYVSDKARLIVPRPGDLNCDGAEDFGDINPFVLALTNPAAYQQKFPDCRLLQGDCNGDGLVDFGDINPFVRILTGP